MSLAIAFLSAIACCHQAAAADATPPIRVGEIGMVSLGKPGFDERGRRTPREPLEVIPYGGTFGLTMQVEEIARGRAVKWMAWFGNVVDQGYTETDDVKLYRSKKGPPTEPLDGIIGFRDEFRGSPARPTAKPDMEVSPHPEKPGAAYPFHMDDGGHNAAYHPLWMRPVAEGENVLHALVHQRFVYHLMFRLSMRHYARY